MTAPIAAGASRRKNPPFFVSGTLVMQHWLQPLVVCNRRNLKGIKLKRLGSKDWFPSDVVTRYNANGATEKQNIYFSWNILTIL